MTEFLANWVHDDPAWDHTRFHFERDAAETNRKLAAIMNATDADLGPFAKRGGLASHSSVSLRPATAIPSAA